MLKVVDSAVPIACWSCSIGHNDSTLFCPHCSKIQPAAAGDFFQVFSLPRAYQIDLPALETEFYRLSRKLHPDRFARASEQEREWSLADTALLNDAYRALKDPLIRTEYLLKLEGAEIGEEFAGADGKAGKDSSKVPADLLEEVFELNMQLEEMRMARKMGEEDPALETSLIAAKEKFNGLLAEVDLKLRAQWATWDAGDSCRAPGCARDDGGPAPSAPLPQQPASRCFRNPGSSIEEMAESNLTGRVVGIDLGTTNSLVAYMQGDAPVVIPGADGLNLVPSVVALDPAPAAVSAEGHRPTVTVGNTARKALIETPERVIYSVKRLMGRGLEEIQDELKLFPFRLADDVESGEVPRIQLGELRFTPPEISAYILRQLKRNAERYFGAPVTQAVITVPAYFNDAQRQATKDAGRMAGLEVLRLVNEPTAAALAYGLDRAKEGTIAVYDFGGGTFDISILKLRDGIFEVQSTNGDTHLGGDDIDNLLLAIALDEIYAEHGVDLRAHPGAVQAVRKAAIEAKIKLSTEGAAQFDIELPNGDRYQREISRAGFELLIEPVLARTAGPCKQALIDAGITPEQVDEVVLVGGSTRIPAVRQLVDDLFHLSARGKTPAH